MMHSTMTRGRTFAPRVPLADGRRVRRHGADLPPRPGRLLRVRAAAAPAPPTRWPRSKPHFPAKARRLHLPVHVRRPIAGRSLGPQARTDQAQRPADAEPRQRSRSSRCASPAPLLGSKYQVSRSAARAASRCPSCSRTWAGCVDDMAIIRGTYADSFAHGSGLLQMNTGFLRQGYPSLGSWVSYGLGTESQNLPGFVVMLDHRGGPIGGPPNWGNGFMPAAYQGTQFRVSGDPIINLSPPAGVSSAQQRGSLDLLGQLNALHAAGHPGEQRAGRAHGQLRAGLPHAGPRPGGGRSGPGDGRDASGCTAWTTRRRRSSAGAACWPGGWSSAACASCRSIPAAATATRTGTPTAT